MQDLISRGGLSSVDHARPDMFYLVSASYEPRTVQATECLSNDYRAGRGIVYYNKEFLHNQAGKAVSSHLYRLQELLETRCKTVETVEGSWTDATHQFFALRDVIIRDALTSLVPLPTITIDVTTFTRESLLTALELIRAHYPGIRIRTLYSIAGSYGPWLSRGYRDIRNIIGFPGMQKPTLPTLLIVLSGYEPERVLNLIEEYEPKKVLLGIGTWPEGPPVTRNVHEQRLILSRRDVEQFSFSADSIKICREQLEDLISHCLNRYNIVLAPLSTKPATLAALLVAERFPQVQIAYCLPGEYNTENYSTLATHLFVGELPVREQKLPMSILLGQKPVEKRSRATTANS
jgi:hypothetical protein